MKKSGKSSPVDRGQGYGTGNSQGQGYGDGNGQHQGSYPGGGRGRNKGGAYGTGGVCICTKCGEKILHRRGVKCTTLKCPECGHTLIREEMVKDKN